MMSCKVWLGEVWLGGVWSGWAWYGVVPLMVGNCRQRLFILENDL